MRSGLIIEDVPETRDWLGSLLEISFPGIAVETAVSVAQGMQRIRAREHDLVLVDLGLPDGSGVACVMERHRRWPGMPSVVSTSFEDDRHLFQALQAGAAGYLLKDQPDNEIIALLRGIATGVPPLSPLIAQKIMAHFVGHYADADADGPAPRRELEALLTPSEKAVLAHIARGLTVPETAKRLGKSRNTVATQLKSVYSKLNVSSRAEVTRMAIEWGLV